MKKALFYLLAAFLSLSIIGPAQAQQKTVQDILNDVRVDAGGAAITVRETEQQAFNAVYDPDNSALRVQFSEGGGGVADVFVTIATLPDSPTSGDIVVVTDGADNADCTTGGGTVSHFCRWNGSAWVYAGGGGALLGVYTVETLPAGVETGTLSLVSDGADGADCETGGGSEDVLCWYDGSSWQSVGGQTYKTVNRTVIKGDVAVTMSPGGAETDDGFVIEDSLAKKIFRVLKNGTIRQNRTNGSTYNSRSISEEVTISVGNGSAGVATSTNMAPVGLIRGVAFYVSQAPGGGATELDIGITGGDIDGYIDGASCDVLGEDGDFFTNGTLAVPVIVRSATTLTLTTDSDVTGSDMIVRVVTFYEDITPPTE
jgi:hypothetical protein